MQATATTHRRFGARPRSGALVDAAITSLTLAGSLFLLSRGGLGTGRHGSGLDLLGATLVAAAALPLVAWRHAAFGVLVASGAASALAAALGYSVGIPLAPTVALYLLAASRDGTHRWTPGVTVAVVALLAAYMAGTVVGHRGSPQIELSLHVGLASGVAWFAGERTRLLRERLADLQQQVARAGRDAELERQLAVAEERARIARDLHDSAGHAINVIAVRAGAARLGQERDPNRSLLALGAIEDMARQTVEEIDQLVGTLREPTPANGHVNAPVGLASLDTLIAHHAATGLQVSTATSGTPRVLGSSVDQAAYRILQEALTNAARHGTGAARVQLAYHETALALTVLNPVAPNAKAPQDRGHGVIGMRERATLLGGTLQAERADGSFRVHAQLPDAVHRA